MFENDPVLHRIKGYAKKNQNVAVVWIYGSRAKGTANKNSDYDLAVAFTAYPADALKRRLQPEHLAYEWASALNLNSKLISLIDINHVPIQLAMSVVEYGKVIQVNDPLRLAREENRITSMWEVDHQYHRQNYG